MQWILANAEQVFPHLPLKILLFRELIFF